MGNIRKWPSDPIDTPKMHHSSKVSQDDSTLGSDWLILALAFAGSFGDVTNHLLKQMTSPSTDLETERAGGKWEIGEGRAGRGRGGRGCGRGGSWR